MITGMTIGYTINVSNFESLKVAVEGEISGEQTVNDLRKELTHALEEQLKEFASKSEVTREFIDKFIARTACNDSQLFVESERYKKLRSSASDAIW